MHTYIKVTEAWQEPSWWSFTWPLYLQKTQWPATKFLSPLLFWAVWPNQDQLDTIHLKFPLDTMPGYLPQHISQLSHSATFGLSQQDIISGSDWDPFEHPWDKPALFYKEKETPYSSCLLIHLKLFMHYLASVWKNKDWFYRGLLWPYKMKYECYRIPCIWTAGYIMVAICSFNTVDYFCGPGRFLYKRNWRV